MVNSIYTLPSISFIGGESQSLYFNLLTQTGKAFDASLCTVGFAIIHYANKGGLPILTKEVEIIEGADGVMNIAVVKIDAADTVNLYGRYVYQITVFDEYGATEIPGHGIIDITRNIHSDFITNREN